MKQKSKSKRAIKNRSIKTRPHGGFGYGDVYGKEKDFGMQNPMNAITYIVKYTEDSQGTPINKEVFIQRNNNYEHYMIGADEQEGDLNETTHKCGSLIEYNRIGDYLNAPYNSSNCNSGINLTEVRNIS